MRKIIFPLFILSCLLLNGCDPAVGPVLLNRTDQDLKVDTLFENGHEISGIAHPGRLWWLGYKHSPLSKVRASTGRGLTFELNEDFLAPGRSNEDADVMVIVFEASGARILPLMDLPEVVNR